MGEKTNPCNICNHNFCVECTLSNYEDVYCSAYDCFLNHEGACAVGISHECGCRRYFDRRWRDNDGT